MRSSTYLCLGFVLFHIVAYVSSEGKSSTSYFCEKKLTCNFGHKQSCLFTGGQKSALKCVPPTTRCAPLWKEKCGKDGAPKCMDLTTECICVCGDKEKGFVEKLKDKIRQLTGKAPKFQ
uniref:Uncharacterized protein n=1 Tax=Rhipicephalus zambeziensis TaxID=60191 RepID=A0A224YLJ6_9ACAR